jgi:hypothetical protein
MENRMTTDPTPYSQAMLEAVRPTVEAKAQHVIQILAGQGALGLMDVKALHQFAELCVWHGVHIGTAAAAGMFRDEFKVSSSEPLNRNHT